MLKQVSFFRNPERELIVWPNNYAVDDDVSPGITNVNVYIASVHAILSYGGSGEASDCIGVTKVCTVI